MTFAMLAVNFSQILKAFVFKDVFDLKQFDNSAVHLNVCHLRCSVISLYLTLSLHCHLQ